MRKEVGLTTYNEGDCIFAKMRGYKYWPERVEKRVTSNRFHIYFYGTNKRAVTNAYNVVKYLENKKKYGSRTMSSSSSFNKPLVEI